MADEPGVQRLVPRATPGNERHLAGLERASAHELQPRVQGHDVRVGGGKAVQRLGQDCVDVVDQFLHGGLEGVALSG